MKFRSAGADRSSRGRRCALGVLLLAFAAFVWRGTPVANLTRTTLPGVKSSLVEASPTATRNVYPFSVIYGGAHSGEELARARKLDAVVARHYAGFGEHVEVEHMVKDTFMYVSYRKADQVYWTKTKRRIPQGELVLSDGGNLARTRCGNRLSPKPQSPISSEHDPTEEAMDVPDRPQPLLASANPVGTAPEADFFIPANPADAGSALSQGDPNSPAGPSNVAGAGGLQTPYFFGSRPGMPGPFLGGVGYPVLPGLSGGTGLSFAGASAGASKVNPGALAVNVMVPENGVITSEPATWALLVVALLLGSPAVVRTPRFRAITIESQFGEMERAQRS